MRRCAICSGERVTATEIARDVGTSQGAQYRLQRLDSEVPPLLHLGDGRIIQKIAQSGAVRPQRLYTSGWGHITC